MAEDIIDKMSGEFQPDKFEDRYENAMIEVVVIDTDDCSTVAFYFADGLVCLVARKPQRLAEFEL